MSGKDKTLSLCSAQGSGGKLPQPSFFEKQTQERNAATPITLWEV